MTIEKRILIALFKMLGAGKKITVYTLADEVGIDRSSIYYRIKKVLLND